MHLDDVLTELVTDSGDRLLRVAYQLTHDRGAAQDLVQDALLRVYQSVRHRGLAPEDWYAYLRRAVINEYVRTRRLRSSTEIVTDAVPERPAAGSRRCAASPAEGSRPCVRWLRPPAPRRSRRERVRGRHQPGDGRA